MSTATIPQQTPSEQVKSAENEDQTPVGPSILK